MSSELSERVDPAQLKYEAYQQKQAQHMFQADDFKAEAARYYQDRNTNEILDNTTELVLQPKLKSNRETKINNLPIWKRLDDSIVSWREPFDETTRPKLINEKI